MAWNTQSATGVWSECSLGGDGGGGHRGVGISPGAAGRLVCLDQRDPPEPVVSPLGCTQPRISAQRWGGVLPRAAGRAEEGSPAIAFLPVLLLCVSKQLYSILLSDNTHTVRSSNREANE